MSQHKLLVHRLVQVYPTLGYIDLVVTFSYSGPCLIWMVPSASPSTDQTPDPFRGRKIGHSGNLFAITYIDGAEGKRGIF